MMYDAIERRVSPATRLLVVQMVRFGVVGASGFVIDTAVVYALRALLGLYVVRLVSFVVAATANWAMHRAWTFRGVGTASARSQWLRFLGANALGASLNIGLYAVLVTISPLCARQPVFAVAAGAAAGMGVNFVLSRRLVFR